LFNGPNKGSQDRSPKPTVALFDVAGGQRYPLRFEGYPMGESFNETGSLQPVEAVRFLPDGQRLVCGSWGQFTIAFDRGGKVLHRFEMFRANATMQCSPDGKILLIAGRFPGLTDGILRLFDPQTLSFQRQIEAHRASTSAVRFSQDGKQIFSSAYDRSLRVFDSTTGERIDEWPKFKYVIADFAITPDGKRLISGAMHGRVASVWDIATKQLIMELPGHRPWTAAVAVSPDGRLVATTDGISTVRLFRLDNGQEVAQFKGHLLPEYHSEPGQGMALLFTSDGKTLFSGSYDGNVAQLVLPEGL
jgi:WD40 repeat protein